MTEHKNNCLDCGKPLVYEQKYSKKTCKTCGGVFESNVSCEAGHYICDICHSSPATGIIKRECLRHTGTNPVILAETLMKLPEIKMHGPEHHFLVPAVLLTCYYNETNTKNLLDEKLTQAAKRSTKVLGGFCGTHGSCGAAMGTGIFISLITNNTSLSKESWKMSNLATAQSLTKIALSGGPRCCKRDSYIAIIEATNFINEEFNVKLQLPEKITCGFSRYNNECMKHDCAFHN